MLTDMACPAIPSVTAARLATVLPRAGPRRARALGRAADQERRDLLGPLNHHQQLARRAVKAPAGEIHQATEIVMTQQRMAILHPLPGLNETVSLLPLAALAGNLHGQSLLPQAHESIQLLR